MKATATQGNGRKLLILGLSNANLDRLRADGLDGAIKVDGKEMGIPFDVIVTSGPTESDIFAAFENVLGPRTKIHVSDKLKS